MDTFRRMPHPVVLFFTLFSCFSVFSRVFRHLFPAPCSAFSSGRTKRRLFSSFAEKALQGARIGLKKRAVFSVFSCFLVFS